MKIASKLLFAAHLVCVGLNPGWSEMVGKEMKSDAPKTFKEVLAQVEGGDEKYSGHYRKDGSLDDVTQMLDSSSESMGPANKHIIGKLYRSYSHDGKIKSISGNVRFEYLETEKTADDFKITKSTDEAVENFDIKLPPLSVPAGLLKKP